MNAAKWLWHTLLWYIECKDECTFVLPFSFFCLAEEWWFIFFYPFQSEVGSFNFKKEGTVDLCQRVLYKKARKEKKKYTKKILRLHCNLWILKLHYLYSSNLSNSDTLWKKIINKWKKHFKQKSISSLFNNDPKLNYFCVTKTCNTF